MSKALKNTARNLAIVAGIVAFTLAAGCGNTEVQGTASAPTDVVDNGPTRNLGVFELVRVAAAVPVVE